MKIANLQGNATGGRGNFSYCCGNSAEVPIMKIIGKKHIHLPKKNNLNYTYAKFKMAEIM